MSALGVYGVTAVTCVVAEVPGKVSAIQAMTPDIVAEQIRLLFWAFPVCTQDGDVVFGGNSWRRCVLSLNQSADLNLFQRRLL